MVYTSRHTSHRDPWCSRSPVSQLKAALKPAAVQAPRSSSLTMAPKKDTVADSKEEAYQKALCAVYNFMTQFGAGTNHLQFEYDAASPEVERLLGTLSEGDNERMNRDLHTLMSGTDPAAQREMILRLQLQTVVTELLTTCETMLEPARV